MIRRLKNKKAITHEKKPDVYSNCLILKNFSSKTNEIFTVNCPAIQIKVEITWKAFKSQQSAVMAPTVHLKLQRYIMLFIGTWNFKRYNNPFLIAYKAYSFFIFWHYIVMTQLVVVSVPMQWECKSRVIELICYYIQYTNNIIMMILSKFSNLQKVLDHILDYEETKIQSTTNVEQKIYFKYAKLNNRVSLFVMALLLGTSVYWYTISIR